MQDERRETLRHRVLTVLVASGWLLAMSLTGCESMQRKFTRKPKHPAPAPTPVINFEDYTRAMTPLDRYRKHYMMFDYWNDELLQALSSTPLNPKRFARASSEALDELKTMKGLVVDAVGVRMSPFIEERSKWNDALQAGTFNPSEANLICRQLEAQSRQVRRELFWRTIEDQLKP